MCKLRKLHLLLRRARGAWLTPFLLPLLLVACANHQASAPVSAAAASSGLVSAADPRAAEAGRWILNRGGSAVDAAIATMLALTVVEPQSSGIGGGSFLVYHDEAASRVLTYDGREKAPDAATPALFLGPGGEPLPFGQAYPGGKSVGVPGNLRLAAMIHERHGKLPWAALFQPAIRLAREGFALSPRMHHMLSDRARHAGMTPWAKGTFFAAGGAPKPVGTVIRNPELAALYESLAMRGADHFYVGPPGQNLVRTVAAAAKNPSRMTIGDLASYDAKERPVQCGTYRGHRICGMGPPSSGATTVFAILKQLERFDMGSMRPDDPSAWHLIAESMRLAYADREAYVGDPDFVPVPTAGLMDAAYLASRSQLISTDRALPSVSAGTPPGAKPMGVAADGEVPSTSHFVAVDKAGNVASMTSTIESVWGSGLTVDGYFLNNELTDFSFVPEVNGRPVANRVEGGKRPRSSMSPTIVYGPDGEVRLAVGAAGGPTIIAQVAKAIIGVIDWELSAQEAIALPQIVAIGDTVRVERGTALEAIIPALTALGHRAVAAEPSFKANAAEFVGGRWVGAADPRSEGAWVAQESSDATASGR